MLGRDVDDPTADPGAHLLRHHLLDNGFGEEKHAGQIYSKDPVPLLLGRFQQWLADVRGRVVDQDVDVSELAHRRVHKRDDLGRDAQIGAHEDGGASGGCDHVACRLTAPDHLLGEVSHHDGCPFCGEESTDRAANA